MVRESIKDGRQASHLSFCSAVFW